MSIVEIRHLMSWTGEILSYRNGFLVQGDAFDNQENFIVCYVIDGNILLKIANYSQPEQYVLDVREDGSVVIGNDPKLFKFIENGNDTFSVSISAQFLSAGISKNIGLAQNNAGWERWKKIDVSTRGGIIEILPGFIRMSYENCGKSTIC